jgi:hypothetical protein
MHGVFLSPSAVIFSVDIICDNAQAIQETMVKTAVNVIT